MSMLNIGTSALGTTQASLATTSHNISNVNTDGYSRQRVDQGTQLPNFQGGYYIGSGVTVSTVERLYDNFLSEQVRTYTSQEAQQGTFATFSRQVDDLLASPALAINEGMDAFFGSVHEVANDPTSLAARQVMMTEGELLTDRFQTLDSQLDSLDAHIDDMLSVSIKDVNNISKGIAELNEAITVASTTVGANPNDLLDQRDQLINQLSEIVSVKTLTQDNGSISVFIGNGQALVVDNAQVDLKQIQDAQGRVSIGYGPTSMDITAQVTGGSFGGALQVRSEAIDGTRTELNLLAQSVVTEFNALHNNVSNVNGAVDLNGAAGGNFFDPASITAATINMVITDPRAIAASSSTNPGVGNNETALAMTQLQTAKTMAGGTQTFADNYGVLVANVATRTHQANIGQKTQEGLLQQVSQQLDSVSGVNLDEEAANLIKFQQAYQAASQIITVSNTIFNSLINAI